MAPTPFDAGPGKEEVRKEEREAQEAQERNAERTRKTKAAMTWLKEQMQDGQPRHSAEVEAQALAAGHAHSTLARARARLGIKSHHIGKGNQWLWIPSARWRSQSSARAQDSIEIPTS